MDLNSGLTQVLADGANTYLYGLNRISQTSVETSGYFLGDALNSVRQVVDPEAEIKLVRSYSPYGEASVSLGDYETDYSYTGELTNSSGLINLRARFYDPGTGRFVSRDTWAGDYQNPITLSKWLYANANPVMNVDPSGFCVDQYSEESACWKELLSIEGKFPYIDLEHDLSKKNYWTLGELQILNKDLTHLRQVMGVSYDTFFPNEIRLKRIRENNYYAATTYFYFTKYRPIRFFNNFDEGTLIHELAHYIDYTELDRSRTFENYVGSHTFLGQYDVGVEAPPTYGVNNPPDRFEDFAETFNEYVSIRTNYALYNIGIVKGEKRWNFVDTLLRTGKMPIFDEILDHSGECLPGFVVMPS